MTREMTRDEAKRSGKKVYDGAPCQSGHGGLRWVSTRHCVECVAKRCRERDDRRIGQHEFVLSVDAENAILAAWYPEEFERQGWRHVSAWEEVP